MNSKLTILACVNPVRDIWQLGPLPPAQGRITLIGWRLPVRSVDSVVPSEVAGIVAAALLSIAKITFPVSESRAEDGDWIESLNIKTSLLTTGSPNSAIRLFNDVGFPWHLQGQVGILSALGSSPPSIARPELASFISDDWASQISRLGRSEILGAIRPGVDGDIAGVFSLSDEFAHSLLIALGTAAQTADADWMSLSEQEFIDALPG